MTSNVYKKSLPLVAVILCLCLSFNSVAGTFLLTDHNMSSDGLLIDEKDSASSGHQHHHTVDLVDQSSGAVKHAETDHHSMSDDCCDDDTDGCLSMSSACAAHCSASVIERTDFCFPAIMTIKFQKVTGIRRTLSVSLAGPFKPPR